MSNLKINVTGSVALVTGANRGIGKAIVSELFAQGATKVYAAARDTSKLQDLQAQYGDKLVPLQLDVTDKSQITKAASIATDVEILINNAGILYGGGFFGENDVKAFEEQVAVNVYGLIDVSRAFLGTLKNQKQAAIVNVSSMAGLGNMPVIGNYSVTKAAVHSITQNFRGELAKDNVLVTGVYPGPIDTDMTKEMPLDKDTPENAAQAIVNGLQNGTEDVFPDQMSSQLSAGYFADPKATEKQFAAFA